jgi:RNA-directed DNA polymerase
MSVQLQSLHNNSTLFSHVTHLSTLLAAALRASRKCAASPARAEFLTNMSIHCIEIREQLLTESYVWGPYEIKEVCDPKRRIIHKAPFRDRVVHQAIAEVLDPILERHLIYHTYACRKNKGTSHALETAMRWVSRKPYALRLDIAQYFASVKGDKLIAKLARIVPDTRLMTLLESLVTSFEPGIPIGNLTSQLFANLYLNDLDHFIKRKLKVKEYLRYMDDLLILSSDRQTAWKLRDAIQMFAEAEGLRIPNHKTSLHPSSSGVPFLGYRLFANKRPRLHRRKIRRLGECLRKAARGPDAEKKRWATIAGWYGTAHFGLTPKLARDLQIATEVQQLRSH